jgi:hypothetical protein
MAAKRACRSLSRSLQHAVSRGAAMLPIKASCAMSEDRNSHGTRSGPSRSAERSRPDDESGNTPPSVRDKHCETIRIRRRAPCVAAALVRTICGSEQILLSEMILRSVFAWAYISRTATTVAAGCKSSEHRVNHKTRVISINLQ